MEILRAIAAAPATPYVLGGLSLVLLLFHSYRVLEELYWRRLHPFTPRSRSLNPGQLAALVRSEGRLHCGEAERHPFTAREDDSLRCGDCGGVFV